MVEEEFRIGRQFSPGLEWSPAAGVWVGTARSGRPTLQVRSIFAALKFSEFPPITTKQGCGEGREFSAEKMSAHS